MLHEEDDRRFISLPQAELATSGATSNPVLATVENSHGRNSGDPISTKLCKLIPIAAVHVDKTVHVADTEALDRRLRVQLPLRAETRRTKLGRDTWQNEKGCKKRKSEE